MSENSYQQLIDDYIKGIQVLEGESLADYIKRMGGVDYPEKRAQGGRIGYARGTEREAGIMDLEADKMLMASESPQEEFDMMMDQELRQEWDEYKKRFPNGTYQDFLRVRELRVEEPRLDPAEIMKWMEDYGVDYGTAVSELRNHLKYGRKRNKPKEPKAVKKIELADGGVANLLKL